MPRKYKQKEVFSGWNSYINYWITRCIRMAVSSVRWDGLPKTIDTQYLEQCINKSGSGIIVYDDVLGKWLGGQNASVGQLDIYGYPMDRRVIFRNGQSARYTPETSVIIYNNSMRSGDLWIYRMVAARMADYDMAINVNMQTQKTMPIIPASIQTKLTIDNLYESYMSNMPYSVVEPNSIDIEAFRSALTFDNKRSFTADGMILVERDVWNWFLTFCGIDNVNNQKKERVIVPEATANNGEVYIMRRDRINARERAAEIMGELWGWEVKVDYYNDNRMLTGGVEDGRLYSAGTYNSGTGGIGQTGDE